MTIEDLREQGVLLPEEEWGEHQLETTVRETPLLAAFLVAVGALTAAYIGDGGSTTWIGVTTFLVCLYAIIWMCDRAVRRQRERFRKERRRFRGNRKAPAGGGDASAGPPERREEGPEDGVAPEEET